MKNKLVKWHYGSTCTQHEIKGWFDDKSKLKLKRMKKYYPEVKIILIDEKQYCEIAKYSSLYKGWGQEPKTKAEI